MPATNTVRSIILSSLIVIAVGAIGLAIGQGMFYFGEIVYARYALIFVILFIALGCGLAVRTFDLIWPLPLYAVFPGAILFTVFLIATALRDQSPFLPREDVSITVAIAMFVLFSSGIFLLPLFDPVVKEYHPGPNVWLVNIFGFLTVAVTILLGNPFFSLIIAFSMGIIIVGAGLVFTLAQEKFGEAIGAYGTMILIFTLTLEALMF